MNQTDRLDYLVEKFKDDSVQYRNLEVGKSKSEKQDVLRSLMNICMPKEIDNEILQIQDEYLLERAVEVGKVSLSEIPTIHEQYDSKNPLADKLSIWQGDITRLDIDAIVNAANSQMLGCFVPMHQCIDNCIHSYAGIELRAECNRQMNHKKIKYGREYTEPTGQAMLTKGYNLPAKYIIHTVGPIVGYQLTEDLKQDLKNCYTNVLKCCIENKIRSVAFCCISTGEFHFPNDEAAKTAFKTVSEILEENSIHFDRVIFNVYKDLDREIYEKLIK